MAEQLLQLDPSRMKPAEYERTLYVVTAQPGSTQEDLLKREYWSHVANKLKPYDKLEVRANDGTFYAEYLVLDCSRVWAKVALLAWYPLSTKDVSVTASDRYRTEWAGPYDKWRIVRNADNEVIARTMAKDEAIIRAAELEKQA